MTGEHDGFPVINGIAINDFRFSAVEDYLFSPTRRGRNLERPLQGPPLFLYVGREG